MKFEKEIKELEVKLEQLKKAASADKLPNSKVIEVIVPEDSGLFSGLYESDITDKYNTVCKVVQIRLFEPTEKAYTFGEANKYASDHGVRLMTKEEIHYLIAIGVLQKGDKSFWSLSVYASYSDNAWAFNGSIGTTCIDFYFSVYNMRCVGRL